MTSKEAVKYLIAPIATSTEPSAEYLKQKEAYELAIKALEERPKGEWITGGKDVTGQYFYDEFICNQCFVVVDNKTNFCPRCGADMRGDKECI